MDPTREKWMEVIAAADQLKDIVHQLGRLAEKLARERDDALRRATEAEQNALYHQAQANVWADAGLRLPTIEIAAGQLIDALERLPLRMEDAGMKQMVTPPDIPLYGTHDWEAVEQAKRRLLALLPERKENDDGGRKENPAGAD